MAEFTYQTRRKWTEDWIAALEERGASLSAREKSMLPSMALYAVPQETREWIVTQLKSGSCKTLSEVYRKHFPDLVDICVGQDRKEEFYYALDQMNQFQMTAGWLRRSVRSKSYEPFAGQSIQLLRAYARLQYYRAELSDILTGRVAEEICDHARTESWSYAGILASQIDLGNRAAIRAVKDILLGEGNTAMISYELIRGIVMSKSRELYELLGRFLLAARLQEGARQAVCETMDAGRPEAFLSLFRVIEENNLIRYSSVKRAVSTWIGIFDDKSIDRITEKLVRLMGQCLRDPAACEEQLRTNDSVAISCGLWAKGFYDAEDAVKAVRELTLHGTRNQKMTASYFNRSLQYPSLKMKAAKDVILHMPEDVELAACFMPSFMDGAHSIIYGLAKGSRTGYYSLRDEKAKEPEKLPVTDLFESREEAEDAYEKLWSLYRQIPKKGITLSPCIFPWYQVDLTQSDVAVRICVLAWMLQKEDYLDEAAELIPVLGQGSSYGTASRAAAVRVLLYRPKSEKRKAVLFNMLHNPEDSTLRSAFCMVEDMELSSKDYLQIEKNLKYKKGRAGTLALLKKQERPQLTACIGRLLGEKSEECHMGALDLALQIKKEDPEYFTEVRPLLSALAEPTGKEAVLLGELLEGSSEAQDILNTPGYGFYDPRKEWVLPPVTVDAKMAEGLFTYGETACITALNHLNALIGREKDREYTTAWGAEMVLGTKLENCRWIRNDPDLEPLDALPFKELWEEYYRTEIKTPELLMELYLFQQCRAGRNAYEKNKDLYKKVFGRGVLKKAPFQNLVEGLRYGAQARRVIDTLFSQYVPDALKARWGHIGTAKLLSVLNEKNAIYEVTEKRWNGIEEVYTRRAVDLPIFESLRGWLFLARDEDWGSTLSLRFKMQEFYDTMKHREKRRSYGSDAIYLRMEDFVRACVRGIWDRDLFYKGVFSYLSLNSLLASVSTIMQRGAVPGRKVRPNDLNSFFGYNVIKPTEGKYHFDEIGEEMPAMTLAREIYTQIVPAVVKVELKRGEQPTPFSGAISSIRVVYGIDVMIQILTALGKDTLERNSGYYSNPTDRRAVLSHLLKVCCPAPEETAADLKKALKGTDITKKRLAEMAMYAQQWIPLLEEYLGLPGFTSGCYYFMAHTSERMDEFITSMVAKYTPLSPEELRDGAFDLNWFFEAYEKLGEKNFKLLYDAAKYSSTGAAHGRARKYADAALGKVTGEELKAEIQAKRNKDLLMSMGLLPLPKETVRSGKAREADLLDRYQFIQKFKKESKAFGAQRRASEGRAVELALRNLSVNAGFTDVMRLTLRMETKLSESLSDQFEWKTLSEADQLSIRLLVDETGKSSLQIRKGEKLLKSVPAKYKKNEIVLEYQENNKRLKEQYRRTRQMMEEAMEDRTAFAVWELGGLARNPVTRPIVMPLVFRVDNGTQAGAVAAESGAEETFKDASEDSILLGFLEENHLVDWKGDTVALRPETRLFIAHPVDLYQEGHWHEYQRLLFEKQIRQPFKQVFRELYVKLSEELEKSESLMFSGNQIQPQKTVGALRGRRWVADYEDGLQKIYYKENIVARIYAMADWFSPSDVEAPVLEWVVFTDRKTFKPLKIKEIPDIIYSEVMRDVDLAVSVAHAGGVDPETSHSTVEMRKAIAECTLELFKVKNVKLEESHAVIDGSLGRYTVHLGSGVVHQMGNSMLYVIPVHSQQRGRLFLPFLDEDPKTAEIISKILLFADDKKIKDPSILSQIR